MTKSNIVTLPKRDPPLMSPERKKAILEAVEGGASIQVAANGVSITNRTIDYWLAWGREELKADPESEEKCAQFVIEYEQAKSKFEQSCIKIIRTAAPTSWQAAAWLLERKFPGRYGKVDRYRGINQESTEKPDTASSREEGQHKLLEKLADIAAKALDRLPADDVKVIEGESKVVEEEDHK